MRCWLFLPMFAVSVCQSGSPSVCLSVCLSRGLNRRRRVQCTPRAVCGGHSVQPLSNYFDHFLFKILPLEFYGISVELRPQSRCLRLRFERNFILMTGKSSPYFSVVRNRQRPLVTPHLVRSANYHAVSPDVIEQPLANWVYGLVTGQLLWRRHQ